MDETRFSRLESRVDEIKDTVSELKANSKVQNEIIKDLKDDFKEHTSLVKEHVAGDTKIITELQPLLGTLSEIVDDYSYKKETKRRKMDKIKYYTARLGLVSLVVGVIVGISKLL